MKHLLSVSDLADDELDHLTAPEIDTTENRGVRGGLMSCVFEQPSLRTASGFAAAAVQLGLAPVFIDVRGHEVRRDLDLYDELEQLCMTSQLVVVRTSHPITADALENCESPVVNAGDGDNEHPTQALVDLAAIRRHFPDGCRVLQMGNLRGHRTQHSLSLALSRMGFSVQHVSPAGLPMPERFSGGVTTVQTSDPDHVDSLLSLADIVYMTPVKYWDNPQAKDPAFELNASRALRVLRPGAKVLHPLPRCGELHRDVDSLAFNGYHDQLRGALNVRTKAMRLLFSR